MYQKGERYILTIVIVCMVYYFMVVDDYRHQEELIMKKWTATLVSCKMLTCLAVSLFGLRVTLWAQNIHEAAGRGDITQVKILLEKDPELLNAMDMKKTPGYKPIHAAAAGGHVEVLEVLIERGADVNDTTPFNMTPLHLAAQNGHKNVVEFLIEKKAQLNVKHRRGDTPIFTAASRGYSEIVAFMLTNGVELNSRGRDGKSLLYVAARTGDISLVEMLIERHMDVNSTNIFDQTPLHFASFLGHEEVVVILLKSGADLNKKSLDGRTPLHCAALGGYDGIVDLLISGGADKRPWKFPSLEGEYMGQEPPGQTPKIFAPGIVSTDGGEFAGTFSPDGREFYFTANSGVKKLKTNTIMVTRRVNDQWTEPAVASFSGQYFDFEPYITPDGKRFFFGSRRPLEGEGEPADLHPWVLEKSERGWSELKPSQLAFPKLRMDYPSMTQDGTMYFTGTRPDGKRGIYVSSWKDGKYQYPERLGEEINIHFSVHHAFIAPDESYIIFDAQPELKGPELYIGFRKTDGTWTRAKKMGKNINATGSEMAGSVSPDGKYFFFTRRLNIYWVDARIILIPESRIHDILKH